MSNQHERLLKRRIAANMDALEEFRRESDRRRSLQLKLADAITNFSGDMRFVYIHVAWFAIWIAINLGWTPMPKFDPYPFGLLTMIVSLEAIFLSTFVLISQNRMMQQSEDRANLDLQIDLLAEHEVTKILTLVDRIATHLGVCDPSDEELKEYEQQVTPSELLEQLHSVAANR